MTSRERFVETTRFTKDVVPPYWDSMGFWNQTVERWHREGLPDGVTPEKYFGMDVRPQVPTVSHFHVFMDPPFAREVLGEDETTVTYRNEFGVIAREFRQDGERSMPQFLDFPVKSRADFEGLRQRLDPGSPRRYPDWHDAARELSGSEDEVGLMISGCFGFQRDLAGYENLALLYYDDPELVRAMCRQWAVLETGICEEVAAHVSVDFVYVWEDMACKNGPLIGPDMFESFILPFYQEVMGRIRSLGIRCIIVDSDGNNDKLMPLFLKGGINGFLPIEIAAGMDPLAMRRRYGEQLLLCGGVDKRVLSRGKGEIERELRSKVPPLVLAGGYIPTVDHSVPPDVSFENYAFYVELLRSMVNNPSRYV